MTHWLIGKILVAALIIKLEQPCDERKQTQKSKGCVFFLNIRRHICCRAYCRTFHWSWHSAKWQQHFYKHWNTGGCFGVCIKSRTTRRVGEERESTSIQHGNSRLSYSLHECEPVQFQLRPFSLIWNDWGNHVNETTAVIAANILTRSCWWWSSHHGSLVQR